MKILGKNYYEILDIPINASNEQIKSAYKIKLIEFHPDKNNQSQVSIAITQDLNTILDILSTPYKKEQYDYELTHATTEKIIVIEKEPLARCIVCKNPLDASWKTYCNTHYREYMQNKNDDEDEGEGTCQECGDTTTAYWKTYCASCYRERMAGR